MNTPAFIETQFPVSRLSKESYKERKAGSGQTLTGLGKWWGRKPLVLVRATIIGLLLPASSDPEADLDIFLKLMTMDDQGLIRRRSKNMPVKDLETWLSEDEKLRYLEQGKWRSSVSREEKTEVLDRAFLRMGYDARLNWCDRPEQIEGPSAEAWKTINAHCGTHAQTLQEWVQQMGEKQFGHTPKVGDAFCGGGSIPFEAARLGCEAYGSDLNPVAALLTWAGLNIIGGGEKVQKQVQEAQRHAFEAADRQITEWGIEHNEKGWRADAYLYCIEAQSPATGYWVPLAPGWIISEKYRVCAVLRPDHEHKRYHIEIVTGADTETFEKAKNGTVRDSRLICPETGQEFSIASLRGDNTIAGQAVYGLRMWENDDLVPRPEDTFQERLYCIRYLEPDGTRHYLAPDENDLAREQKVLNLLRERFDQWQEKGFIPSAKIPSGDKTDEPIRTRGWTHWHHLFNPRQLLVLGEIGKLSSEFKTIEWSAIRASINQIIDNFCKLNGWNSHQSKGPGSPNHVFTNQALNPQLVMGCRAFTGLKDYFLHGEKMMFYDVSKSTVETTDARNLTQNNHFWITDPPYADAVNYHELGDFFLAWYEKHLPRLFPEWYADSRAALAVKGKGRDFNRSMVEVYRNLAAHMPDNGAQVVMFTHQDAKVWADLALILWASGLRVTAAWTIQTETDAGGIKKGNYVQGTVLMVLRKQLGTEVGFLTDIQVDIEAGVKKQIDFMRALDKGDDPNFGDADYQLAAYAAALRELTAYRQIGEIDVEYELSKDRKSAEKSEVEKIIDVAVKVAMDYLVPKGMEERYWRKLQPEERFYLKGLEIELGGEYRSGVYMEMARGYGIHEYKHLIYTSKANETRLRTASEFKNKELSGAGFGSSLTRQILFAIHETRSHDDDPRIGRNWLYTEWPGYWEDRAVIIHLLEYILSKCAPIAHWKSDIPAADLLRGYLENDTPG
ncbi:MAG: anti-phage-associated DUF1156 domain-containing protein [Bacteroidia bacterium]|nr:anti-phage-associated DUF1156 domain-containing protein [Bacteroidia bacterium]